MLKKLKRITVITLTFIFLIPGAYLFAQDGGGVNSTAMGLNIHGGLGYGQTVFGYINDADSTGDLGTGPGGAIDLGAMFNFNILAVSVNFVQANFSDMEFKESDHTYKSEGDGYFRTLELLVGLKLFTEEDDMGYTLLYGGYKMWNAERNIDKITLDGVSVPFTIEKYELEGDGWIAGYRDLSTFNLVAFSLALQTGFWFQKMPISTVKMDGDKEDFKETDTAGLGVEFGLGVAFENMGLSVIGSVKVDITASVLDDMGGEDDIAGSGYSEFFITVTKDFAI
ncbi:MAG TPA: hypothetical protein PK358_07695 [Spirochaetota bacterium]|nr:hypothetical protein [Spirochaetota bacterium]HPJ34702.1 hypothetical protein [Spirochaetota bacterium]